MIIRRDWLGEITIKIIGNDAGYDLHSRDAFWLADKVDEHRAVHGDQSDVCVQGRWLRSDDAVALLTLEGESD